MTSRIRVTPAAVLLTAFALSGCSQAEPPNPEGASAKTTVVATAASAVTGSKAEPPRADGRMVVSEATLSIRTTHPEGEADAVGRYVADAGGYVVSREAARSSDVATNVEMTIRVPASKFDATLAELRRHGTVLTESMSGKDVTEEFTDTEAQLKSKRHLEERLLHIVDGSTSVKDMLEVENELTRVRTDIERLEGHSKLLANQASFATIRASFVSPAQPVAVESESLASRFGNAFRMSCSLFVHVATGLIVTLGVILPLGVPIGAVAYVVARRRRRLTANGM